MSDPNREIEALAAMHLAKSRAEATDDPCDCPLVDHEQFGPHTIREHRRYSCGGAGMPEPCGGCYDCLIVQIAYWDRLEADRARERATTVEPEVQEEYDNFWKPIVEYDGSMNPYLVMRELADYSNLMHAAQAVYCSITGNRVSKMSTTADGVLQAHEDYLRDLRKRWGEDLLAELKDGLGMEDEAMAVVALGLEEIG